MSLSSNKIEALMKIFLKNYKFIAVISFALFLSWALINPFGKAPDERAHFGLMQFIAQYHSIPVAGDARLSEVIGEYSFWYGALPPLPYIAGALGIAIGSIVKFGQLYLYARIISVLLGVGTVFLSFKIAKILFPKNYLFQLCVPLIVMLIPQLSFLFSYANNDAFTIFAVVLFYYFLLLLKEENYKPGYSLFLGLSAGLCLLSKPNAYIIIPLLLIYYLLSIRTVNWKTIIGSAAISGFTALVVSGWWFVRNYILYNGDLLALKTSTLTDIIGYKEQGWTLTRFLLETHWLKSSFVSLWAAFDHMNIFLPKWYYIFIFLLVVASLMGILTVNKKGCLKTEHNNRHYFIISILAIIFSVSLSIWNSYTNDYQPQGKYLYTSLIPLVSLFIFGLQEVIKLLLKKSIYITYFFAGLVVVFFAFNVYSLVILCRIFHCF